MGKLEFTIVFALAIFFLITTNDQISGMTGKLVEYPFDTLKVRLQTGPYAGATDCITTISKEEGLLAFYRGLATPLVGAGIEVATLFFG